MFTGPVFLGLYISQISTTTNAIILATSLFLLDAAWHLLKVSAKK